MEIKFLSILFYFNRARSILEDEQIYFYKKNFLSFYKNSFKLLQFIDEIRNCYANYLIGGTADIAMWREIFFMCVHIHCMNLKKYRSPIIVAKHIFDLRMLRTLSD